MLSDVEKKVQPFKKRMNYFGFPVYSPLALFASKEEDVITLVRDQLSGYFEGLGRIPSDCWDKIQSVCEGGIRKFQLEGTPILEVERTVEQDLMTFFGFKNHHTNVHEKSRNELLAKRAKKIVEQIVTPLKTLPAAEKPFWTKRDGVTVLDMGAGDGLVSHYLMEAAEKIGLTFGAVTLADVHEYYANEVKKRESDGELAFLKLEPDYENVPVEQLKPPQRPPEEGYDLILLLTVLHHSYAPRRTFRACWEALAEGGLIIVIESCAGITGDFIKAHPNYEGKCQLDEDPENAGLMKRFLKLDNPTEQVLYAGFIDWFYNRIQHEDVLVPCEYNSPLAWNDFFEQFAGMKCLKTYAEGFDQETVPEFHTMHVLCKEQGA